MSCVIWPGALLRPDIPAARGLHPGILRGYNRPLMPKDSSPSLSRRIERLCHEKGLKMTEQRRVIARVLSESDDHPDVEQLHRRAIRLDSRISIATVYRTVRLLEEADILTRHDFGDRRARYEEVSEAHHDHLVDIDSGEVIEFNNEEIERLQVEVARRLGYRLVDHRLELYGVRLKPKDTGNDDGKNGGD